MSTVFERAFAVVIGEEGGYSHNPADPGGETKYGISRRAYPEVDIANLTLEGAKAIYRRDYWDKIQGDALHPSLALIVMDSAVNNGVGRAAKWLQGAAGVIQDGVIGPATMAAVGKHPASALVVEFMAQRMRFQFMLPTAATFGLGWARRLAALPFAAIALEPKDGIPAPVPAPLPAPAQQPVTLDEIAIRHSLEDKSYTDALNQRTQP